MGTYRSVLRYKDTSSGLGWSLTTYQNAATPAAVFALADTWNTLYISICPPNVEISDIRVSNVAIWNDVNVYFGAGFATPVGTALGNMVPLAECLMIEGRNNDVNQLGWSYWHLHGISAAVLTADGTVNAAHAGVAALSTGSGPFMMQYRKVATPVKLLPVVDPPQPYPGYLATGPYVRRLGNPFTLPGQRARYARA